MPKHTLTALAVTTFVVFGILLSIGIGISAKDQANDLESRILVAKVSQPMPRTVWHSAQELTFG